VPDLLAEERHAAAEHHGRNVKPDLVDEPGCQALLDDARAPNHNDVLPGRGLDRQLNRTRDTVGHEVEGCWGP
jgi:hypothetical protein